MSEIPQWLVEGRWRDDPVFDSVVDERHSVGTARSRADIEDDVVARFTDSLRALHKVVRHADKAKRVTIYRMISVPEVERIEWKNIGIYWSGTKEGAGIYTMNHRHGQPRIIILLVGDVDPADVDWLASAAQNHEYPEEVEITLREHAAVRITEVSQRAALGSPRGWYPAPVVNLPIWASVRSGSRIDWCSHES